MESLPGPIVLLKYALKNFRINWKILLLIVLIPAIVLTLGILLLFLSNIWTTVIGCVVAIVGVVLMIVRGAVMIDTIHKLETKSGTSMNLKKQFFAGLSIFWSILFLTILQAVILLGGGVLFIIPALIIGIYICFALYALVLDGKKIFESFTYSYSLVHGRWWKVFGRNIFIGIFSIICVYILNGLLFLVNMLFSIDTKSLGSQIVDSLLSFVLSLVITSISSIYVYRLYQELKKTSRPAPQNDAFRNWLYFFIIIGVIVGLFVVTRMFSLIGT